MRKINITLFLLLWVLSSFAQKVLIDSQSEDFPLYTELDSSLLAPYNGLFRFGAFDMVKCIRFRQFLEPYVLKEDPQALYLYARSFDLFEFGLGDLESAKIALKYYKKAETKGYSIAALDLAGVYRYNFMNLGDNNKERANTYLSRAIKHGNNSIKVKAMKQILVNFKDIQPDSTIYYLEKIIRLAPHDTWSIDYLASLYEKKGDYQKAAQFLRQSNNINSQLKLAEWLIEGKNIKQDIEQGLHIIYTMYDKISTKDSYMGSKNPVLILCKYYRCQKLITKEQLRGIDLGAADCCW